MASRAKGTPITAHLRVKEYEYYKAIRKMFLISMVARIFDPGCKTNHMLVLEGAQGELFKSTACKVLAGASSPTACRRFTGGKDVSQHLRGKWLITIGFFLAIEKKKKIFFFFWGGGGGGGVCVCVCVHITRRFRIAARRGLRFERWARRQVHQHRDGPETPAVTAAADEIRLGDCQGFRARDLGACREVVAGGRSALHVCVHEIRTIQEVLQRKMNRRHRGFVPGYARAYR